MNLPNGEAAVIAAAKITDYLLSESHAVGRAKARFFREVGYDPENPSLLMADLSAVARNEAVTEVVETDYGSKYILDGAVTTPSGSVVRLRTVWIVDAGQTIPRFVTAYPAP